MRGEESPWSEYVIETSMSQGWIYPYCAGSRLVLQQILQIHTFNDGYTYQLADVTIILSDNKSPAARYCLFGVAER